MHYYFPGLGPGRLPLCARAAPAGLLRKLANSRGTEIREPMLERLFRAAFRKQLSLRGHKWPLFHPFDSLPFAQSLRAGCATLSDKNVRPSRSLLAADY